MPKSARWASATALGSPPRPRPGWRRRAQGGWARCSTPAPVLALASTGLIGEVFYTGAVAISLTHPKEGRPPPLGEIARMVNYGPLIAIDLIYGALVAIGLGP